MANPMIPSRIVKLPAQLRLSFCAFPCETISPLVPYVFLYLVTSHECRVGFAEFRFDLAHELVQGLVEEGAKRLLGWRDRDRLDFH